MIRKTPFLLGTAIVLTSCTAVQRSDDPAVIGQQQARLAGSSSQAALWEAAAAANSVEGIQTAVTNPEVVAQRRPVTVVEKTDIASKFGSFPENLATGVVARALPEIEPDFVGRAVVDAVEDEIVQFDLGGRRLLALQAKVKGFPLNVNEGDVAEIVVRQGDIYKPNDVVAVALPDDDVIRALVSDQGPVRIDLPTFAFSAQQIGEPKGNQMPVDVTISGESKVLAQGDEEEFSAGLTVRLTASLAIQGPSVNALEGDPYRIELIAWRTRDEIE